MSFSLDASIELVTAAFPGNNASDMLKFIASAESNYGNYDIDEALSYGAYQIDPIRFFDIIQNTERANETRIDSANNFLRKHGMGNEFDLRKLADYNETTKNFDYVDRDKMHNPLVATTIARLALMQDPNAIPGELEEMANYYFDFWSPKVNSPDQPGYEYKRSEAKRKFKKYNPEAYEDSSDIDNQAFDAMVDSTLTPTLDSINLELKD